MSSSSLFTQCVDEVLSNPESIDVPCQQKPFFLTLGDIRTSLPVFRSRPPSIPTKLPYPYLLNPDNVSDFPAVTKQQRQASATGAEFTPEDSLCIPDYVTHSSDLHQTQTVPFKEQSSAEQQADGLSSDISTLSPPESYPHASEVWSSPYGPHNFQLSRIQAFPILDDMLNLNSNWFTQTIRSVVFTAITHLTQYGISQNNVYTDRNDNLIQRYIDSNHPKSSPAPAPTPSSSQSISPGPLLTVSNHNSTIDDPFILVAAIPEIQAKTARWEICGQDICYPSTPIGAGFMAGKVLPVQRGSGLWQSHFTRLHNLLSNNEWVHIFPEGRVIFTPNYEGIDHDLRDPPAHLLDMKWGTAALIGESLLRGENLHLVPITHTSARVHPRSAGVPDFHQDCAVLVGNDLCQIDIQHSDSNIPSATTPASTPFGGVFASALQTYTNHVTAWEQGRVGWEPRKEDLFLEITNILHHQMSRQYVQTEKHSGVPTHLSWSQNAPNLPAHSASYLDENIPRSLCDPNLCFCRHDDGFAFRSKVATHARVAHDMKQNTAQWSQVRPWYSIFPQSIMPKSKLTIERFRRQNQPVPPALLEEDVMITNAMAQPPDLLHNSPLKTFRQAFMLLAGAKTQAESTTVVSPDISSSESSIDTHRSVPPSESASESAPLSTVTPTLHHTFAPAEASAPVTAETPDALTTAFMAHLRQDNNSSPATAISPQAIFLQRAQSRHQVQFDELAMSSPQPTSEPSSEVVVLTSPLNTHTTTTPQTKPSARITNETLTPPLLSSHDTPGLHAVRTRKLTMGWNIEAHQQKLLGQKILRELIPNNQWGTGKYCLGWDGYYPDIFNTQKQGSWSSWQSSEAAVKRQHFAVDHSDASTPVHQSQPPPHALLQTSPNDSPPSLDNVKQPYKHQQAFQHGPFEWHTIWQSRFFPVRSRYFEYLPEHHGFIIDPTVFTMTWKEYGKQLTFPAISNHLENMSRAQNPAIDITTDQSLQAAKRYAAETTLIYKRFEALRQTPNFDWNGSA